MVGSCWDRAPSHAHLPVIPIVLLLATLLLGVSPVVGQAPIQATHTHFPVGIGFRWEYAWTESPSGKKGWQRKQITAIDQSSEGLVVTERAEISGGVPSTTEYVFTDRGVFRRVRVSSQDQPPQPGLILVLPLVVHEMRAWTTDHVVETSGEIQTVHQIQQIAKIGIRFPSPAGIFEDCLQVRGSLEYGVTHSGKRLCIPFALERTWCAGIGMVSERQRETFGPFNLEVMLTSYSLR